MAVPEKYFRNNCMAGLTLIDTMLKFGVPYLIFSSTAATYGEPDYVPIDEEHPKKTHQRLRREQADRGAHAPLERQRPWPQIRGPALLQRGRRPERREHWRRSQPRDPPHPPGAGHRPGPAGKAEPLRHRLSHPGRHLRARLHPRGGSDRRPSAGPGIPEGRQSLRRLQPGQRPGLHQPGDHRDRPARHRLRHPRIRGGPPPRRPRRLDRLSEKAMEVLGWNPKHAAIEDIIGSAWNWHRTHPEGYRTNA